MSLTKKIDEVLPSGVVLTAVILFALLMCALGAVGLLNIASYVSLRKSIGKATEMGIRADVGAVAGQVKARAPTTYGVSCLKAAAVLAEAFKDRLQEDWAVDLLAFQGKPGYPSSSFLPRELRIGEPLPREVAEGLRDYGSETEELRQLLLTWRRETGEDFAVYGSGHCGILTDHRRLRRLLKQMRLLASYERLAGSPEKGLRWAEDIIRISMALRESPESPVQVIRYALIGQACMTIETVLSRSPDVDTDVLVSLQSTLGKTIAEMNLPAVIESGVTDLIANTGRIRRTVALEACRQLHSRPVLAEETLSRVLWEQLVPAVPRLKYSADIRGALIVLQVSRRSPHFLFEWTRDHRWSSRGPWALLSVYYLDSLTRVTLAQTAIAAERFRRSCGHWPSSLSGLTDGFLTHLPSDPFSGKDVLLVTKGDHLVIYSVGWDGQDGGGDPTLREHGHKDLTFVLIDSGVRNELSYSDR